jgi:hypothetical protein
MATRKTLLSFRSPSPHRGTLAVAVALLLATASALTQGVVTRSQAAGAAAAINGDALDAMLANLKKQQEQIASNQTKVETQLAALKEELRLTKIYSARSGAGGRR